MDFSAWTVLLEIVQVVPFLIILSSIHLQLHWGSHLLFRDSGSNKNYMTQFILQALTVFKQSKYKYSILPVRAIY